MRLPLRRLAGPVAALATLSVLAFAPHSAAAAAAFVPFRVHGQPVHAITLTEERQFAALSVPDLARIKDDGFNTVTIYVYRYVASATANQQKTGALTEPDAVLGQVIDRAHSTGLAVQLIPTIWVGLGVGPFYWRGAIHPTDRSAFFDSYRAMTNHYADLATQHHVEIFGIGSEMMSLENEVSQWQHTISDAKQHFKGPITYFAIYATVDRIKWWKYVDLPGVSPYMSLSSQASPGYDEIVNNWKTTQLPYLRRIAAYVGRPLQIAEIGYGSGPGAATHPDQVPSGTPDETLQVNLYRAMLDVVLPDPSFDGISFWRWSAYQSGPGDTGFSPKGKAAECVIAQHWAAPGSTSLAQCSAFGRVSL
ncbi:MAG: hypothetical protein JWL79_2451 [Frankiales bacterium]|nr:hypothetical protein [Frankiales bacterium]